MRELARALGPGVVSSSRIHDAFTKPRLPTWGLVEMLVTELGSRTPGADAAVEVKRFHALWDVAAEADSLPQAADEPGQVQEAAPSMLQAATGTDAFAFGRPVPSTLLLADIARFNGHDDVEQGYMRRMLSNLLDRVAEAAGIDPAARRRMDQGDGFLELIDAAVPMTNLLRTVLGVVPTELRTLNRLASDSVQLRPRLVLATGNVSMDGHGWTGAALNDACRLLDADAVRAALHDRTDNYVLCVSDAVYWTTVSQNHPGISTVEFHEIGVQTKNGSMRAWLHQPLSAHT
ncbi:hypothetical protein [Streptomyces hydrogenans]|uniref:Guanylate cyclase domain-containing protein n=1 Tax=Streptomyces hydrogenans TaxID=1873719 RepID=A0ABQ3PQ50_9ACTN|nr:hypothetical protein [Streptomyces hydrogenans]GHG29474.1 hypothetical protein GCM10018784_48540 [Streptomyces hydrogenans]GHI27138.1 hypothetical protein Shyd_85090 [Streptomyces hydrogenans]